MIDPAIAPGVYPKTHDGRAFPSHYDVYQRVLALGSSSLHRFGGKFGGGANLEQNPVEYADFICAVIESGVSVRSYLEIGSAAGGTARAIHEFFAPGVLAIIDDNQHKNSDFRPRVLTGIEIEEFIGNSHSQEAHDWLRGLGQTFDLIFIDGDHSYEGARQDYMLAKPLLRKPGIIAFHDVVCWVPLAKLWSEIEGDKKTFCSTDHKWGIGMLFIPETES